MPADPIISETAGKMIKVIAPYLIIGVFVFGILKIIIALFNKKVDRFADSLAGKLKKSKKDKCPYCEGSLVEKSGRYGKFLACSNYPKCKYTKNKY